MLALKTIAKATVKSATLEIESKNDLDDGIIDNEALNLMVKRFSKYLKYKNKSNNTSAGNRIPFKK